MKGTLDNKVQPQSLVDVVAERIEAAIISGQLEPGSRLSEQALATSLGVSRGPLREAIRRLEGRKLLERTPNIGVRVAALSLRDLNEILQVREALEGMACGLAALNMPDAEIAALRKLLDGHEKQKSVQENRGYYQESKDFDFHFRIVAGSGNERLQQMLTGDLYYRCASTDTSRAPSPAARWRRCRSTATSSPRSSVAIPKPRSRRCASTCAMRDAMSRSRSRPRWTRAWLPMPHARAGWAGWTERRAQSVCFDKLSTSGSRENIRLS
jgi:DNA-binding GntR family transcriptional regulator